MMGCLILANING